MNVKVYLQFFNGSDSKEFIQEIKEAECSYYVTNDFSKITVEASSALSVKGLMSLAEKYRGTQRDEQFKPLA